MGVGRGALEEEGGKKRYQDAACQGVAAAAGQGRAEEAQAEAPGSAPKLLLHGCEVPRMLQDHHATSRLQVFSHAQTVVVCSGCSTVLCQSTGGRARLTEGCSFRKKSQK